MSYHKSNSQASAGKILCIVIAVLVACVLSIVICINFVKKHFQSNKFDENNVGEIYYQGIDMEHVATDENGIMYADNEILVVAADGTSHNKIEKLADKYGAEIVGWIEQTGDYQLHFDQVYSRAELELLVSEISENKLVYRADINYIADLSCENVDNFNGIYYGEKWQSDLQDYSDCKGNSWGLEAINVLEAWDTLSQNKDRINPVKIGIIDNGFDTSQEDLQFAETFYNDGYLQYYLGLSDKGKHTAAHGTHVAGTIAAKANDTTGICGVYPYGDKDLLYGVAISGINGVYSYFENLQSVMYLKIGYAELILRNVKVINNSLGFNWHNKDKFKNNNSIDYNKVKDYFSTFNYSEYEEDANILADFFNRLLDKGYDFVISASAGNDSDSSIGHLESKCNFWLTLIDENRYPEVFNRIIVVGAIDYHFNIASYSNSGDRVDVYAPGGDLGEDNKCIYSTFPEDKYDYMHGTSMAAPHVAGVAAMVWTANNNLKGDEVKKIVCTSGKLDGNDTFDRFLLTMGFKNITFDENNDATVVNAANAVKLALGYELGEASTKGDLENSGLLCWVVNKDNEDEKIEGATVTAINVETGETASTITDAYGHFELILPEGNYSLTVTHPDYEDYIWPGDNEDYQNPIVVTKNSVNYLDDWIKMKKASGSISGQVIDESGNPIENAEVTAAVTISNTIANKKATTDSDGYYRIKCAAGNYKIQVTADGYEDYRSDEVINVEPGFDTIFDIITLVRRESIPEMVQAVQDYESTWKASAVDYQNSLGYSDVYCWFQDLDMDGTCEFIVGPMVSGAHAAHDYEIWTYRNGSLVEWNFITLWLNDTTQIPDGSDTFRFQLFRNQKTGAFLYACPGADGVASQTYFWIDIADCNNGGNLIQKILITDSTEGNDEYYVDDKEVSKSDLISAYDAFFSSLTPYQTTVSDFRLSGYLSMSGEDKKQMLLNSYKSWQYSEFSNASLPLNEVISKLRSESVIQTESPVQNSPLDQLVALAKNIRSTRSDGQYYYFSIITTSTGLYLCADEAQGLGSSFWMYNANGNEVYFGDGSQGTGGCQIHYDGQYYDVYYNISGDGSRYVDMKFPLEHEYVQDYDFDAGSDPNAPCYLDGNPISLDEFNAVYNEYLNNYVAPDYDCINYFHDGIHEKLGFN